MQWLGSSLVAMGRLRFTKFCWGRKHVNIIMKPTNSPTQGQPNPKKIRLKVAFGPLFPTAKYFFGGLGLVLYRKQTARNQTQPNSPQTPFCCQPWCIRRCHPYARKYAQRAEGRHAKRFLCRNTTRRTSHRALRAWCN